MSVVQDIEYFGGVIHCVGTVHLPLSAGKMVMSLSLAKDARALYFLSGDVRGWSFGIGQNRRYLQSDLLCFRKFISKGICCFVQCQNSSLLPHHSRKRYNKRAGFKIELF